MWRAGREAGFYRTGQGDIVMDMIKALEQAVEKVKKLSAERQEYAAAVLEQIAEAGDGIYTLTDEERRLVREGLDQLDRGDVATDAEVRAVFDKYRA
jgi:DNA-binding protein H-NS